MTNEPEQPTSPTAFDALFGSGRGRVHDAIDPITDVNDMPHARWLVLMAYQLREGHFDDVYSELAGAPCSTQPYDTLLGMLSYTLAERLAHETRALLLWSCEVYMLGELHPQRPECRTERPLCGALHLELGRAERDGLWSCVKRAQQSVVVAALSSFFAGPLVGPYMPEWLDSVLGDRLPALRASMLLQHGATEATVTNAFEYCCLDGVFAATLPERVGDPVDWPRFVALTEQVLLMRATDEGPPF